MSIDFKSKQTKLIGAGILALAVIILIVLLNSGGSDAPVTSDQPPATAEAPATDEPAAADATPPAVTDDETVTQTETALATEEEEVLTPVALSQDEVSEALAERSLGDADAPATIHEFSSLTCSHCGDFHKNTFKELKTALIDTGKARLIMSDFPLNGPALHAAMVARCLPADKYFDFTQLLFETQDQWAYSADYKKYLKQNAQLAGLSAQQFENCFASEPLRAGVLEMVQKAQQAHQISSTPSFVVNGATKVEGGRSVADFEKAIAAAPKADAAD